jgi:hypothetical protein
MPWPGPVFLQPALELIMARPPVDADLLPLTAEGIQEETTFEAARAKSGGQLRRIATGYILAGPGVIRHFADLTEARAHVFHGGDDLED